jgi:O-antigen ligase
MNRNDPRFFEFKAGAQVVSKNFLIGVGVGDIQNHLDEAYQKSGFQQGVDEKLNVHNEFLHDTMAVGVVGFLLVTSAAIASFWNAFRAKNFLQFGFAVLFFLCCMSEVMLNRQKGITFFAFFICLLYIVPTDEKNTTR